MSKFEITSDQIDAVVAEFYRRVRLDEVLGPIFKRAIGSQADAWRAHEAHIANFWRSAIGLERSFQGNPMMKHLANPDVQPEHFTQWLFLFRATAIELLPTQAAQDLSNHADNIGKSLSMGIVQIRQKRSATPILG